MLRTRLRTSLAALAAVAVVLSACSGEDTDNLSKSQFAKKANKLCTKAQARRARQLQQLPSNPSGPSDAQKLRSMASTDRELVRRVDDLVPPPAEEDRVDRLLDAWRRRAKLEGQYATAVSAMQDPQTLAMFTTNLAQIDATADAIAMPLGLTDCTRATS